MFMTIIQWLNTSQFLLTATVNLVLQGHQATKLLDLLDKHCDTEWLLFEGPLKTLS